MIFYSKLHSAIAVSVLVCLEGANIANAENATACPDPLSAILAILKCVEEENVTCASAGYNSAKFTKLHNEVDTNTTIDAGGDFWTAAFALVDLSLDINHKMNIGPNRASIRYVEVVNFTTGVEFGLPSSTEYPFGQSFVQHEHALVTVDNDCKMTLWDQYGDNEEQSAVDDTAAALLLEPAVQCAWGLMTPEECANKQNKTDSAAPSSPSEQNGIGSASAAYRNKGTDFMLYTLLSIWVVALFPF
mmetsp:Transcript_18394/g.34137  ORF Transcript_18394/g.34137 Transcript_18394/m.34137 type:complete len:246 (-) Transcript_18394:370-1107(-)|eukprot:CAMPEP_0197436244 /NCGR_PEP_ID=MMETSP1175-20131217/3715_1 /TAXON_ID=1003142 /ORGANISM="Triceratium dubium, Strain CCMP147" /LENGTH=245 /DNA_ID=CAMNT_0042965485 /DNA_START=205 /DNA_END=942 /DNA_ORIENTATION=-